MKVAARINEMHLGRWLPWRLLLGPIFLKEVTVSGRRKGVYALRCGYTMVLAAATALAFIIALEEFGWHSGAAARMERLQEIAPLFGEVFGWMQIILLTLVGTVLTAAAFSEERTNRTLHSLMTTPLTSAQIVFGKLSSRLLQIVILAMIPMPVLLGLRVYGGLEAERILAGTMLAITSAGFSASISLLLSIFNKRAWSVIVLSCVAVFAVQIAPIILFFAAEVGTGYPSLDIALRIATVLLSPFAAFFDELRTMAAPPGLWWFDPSLIWVATCATLSLMTVGVCLVAAAVLRPVALSEKSRILIEDDAPDTAPTEAATGKAQKRRSSPGKKLKRRLAVSRAGIVIVLLLLGGGFALVIGGLAEQTIGFYIGAAMPIAGFLIDLVVPHRRAQHSREVGDRPVFWRELRASFVGSRGGVIILGVFVAGILFMAYRGAPVDMPELHMAILGGFLGVQLLASATMTTGRISSERDARTWDTLLCTPLSAHRIVWEKLRAGFVQLLPIPAVMLTHMIVYMVLGVLPLATVVCVTSLTLASTAMLCSTGLLLGMWRAKTVGVAVMNMGFAFCLWIGLPFGSLILAQLWQTGPADDERLASLMLFFNPVYLSITSIDGALSDRYYRQPYALGMYDMGELAFVIMVLASAAVLTLIGLGAAALSVVILRKRSMRAV